MNTTVAIATPTLQQGSQGAAVRRLQTLLLGRVGVFGLTADGIFGPTTELAVRVFQTRAFLENDGIVGPQTWQVLQNGGVGHLPILGRGNSGVLVRRLQRALSFGPSTGPATEVQSVLGHRGFYFGVIDGEFGPVTEHAVKAFQQLPLPERLPLSEVDGRVGPETWSALTLLVARITHIGL
ncbi:MAG: peptidoglycan-binding protein [Synechococcales cyanobacterium CRU_2_2]|nr:peptidoglycan-binding protein [Synechococcales cyanobacterium CRU_2_2]